MAAEEQNPMTKIFPVASICREDLLHPAVGFTLQEARLVTDEQMMEIARRLGRNTSNQIVKNSIKMIANTVVNI